MKTSTADVHPQGGQQAPVMSSLSRSWCVSPILSHAMTTITTPMGTFMRNANRHEMTVSNPPSTRPITEPMACMPAETAIA